VDTPLTALLRRSRILLRGLDPVTTLALALLCGAAIFQVAVLDPAAERLRTLEARWAAITTPAPLSLETSRTSPAEKLGAFYAHFQRDLKLSDWLARFHDVADRAGVRITQVEYRLLEDRDAPLRRMEIVLPLTGDYGRIRAFAEGVLTAIPIASLDHIAFRRSAPAQGDVEAELKFTLHRTMTP
jgi:hypothetical protein